MILDILNLSSSGVSLSVTAPDSASTTMFTRERFVYDYLLIPNTYRKYLNIYKEFRDEEKKEEDEMRAELAKAVTVLDTLPPEQRRERYLKLKKHIKHRKFTMLGFDLPEDDSSRFQEHTLKIAEIIEVLKRRCDGLPAMSRHLERHCQRLLRDLDEKQFEVKHSVKLDCYFVITSYWSEAILKCQDLELKALDKDFNKDLQFYVEYLMRFHCDRSIKRHLRAGIAVELMKKLLRCWKKLKPLMTIRPADFRQLERADNLLRMVLSLFHIALECVTKENRHALEMELHSCQELRTYEYGESLLEICTPGPCIPNPYVTHRVDAFMMERLLDLGFPDALPYWGPFCW